MKGGVRKRGKKWYYYFDAGIVDGKRKKIERVGGITKKEAQDALRNALNEFDNCGSIIDESNISVSDYLDFWFNEYVLVNCKFYTQVNYNSIIKNHIKPAIGIYKLKSLTPARLQEYFNDKYKEGLSRSTLDSHRGILSLAFKMATYPYKYIKENPMTYIRMPKDTESRKESVKTISVEDFQRISTKYPFGHKLHVPLQIAFHTGLRASEVCGLTWDNIDFDNKTLSVEKILITKKANEHVFQTPKTKSSVRTIHIGDTLLSLLKKNKIWQNENRLKYGEFYNKCEHDFVCLDENGTNVTTIHFRHMCQVINKQLGIQFNFHMLRHTHASLLFVNGANPKDIQERLGHSRLDITMDTYSHLTKELKKETVDIFESIIK